MSDESQACFACTTRTRAAALRDDCPRMLCLYHKERCTLPGGVSLDSALHLAQPPGAPLEGSSLAYVYNPVFVAGSTGATLKGWTDFAGGGMAVLEDRFGASNRFEHWALERAGLRALWQPLLDTHTHDGDRLDLPALAAKLDEHGKDINQHGWDCIEFCISAAMGNWQLQTQVEERRATAISQWPASFAELEAWLTSEPQDVALPPDWTNDPVCVGFTSEMVLIGRKWLATIGPAV
jgi:hypothetical protein